MGPGWGERSRVERGVSRGYDFLETVFSMASGLSVARDSEKPRDALGMADESAAAAAARVLAARLGAVHDLLRGIAGGDDSEEAVHALRVATRRAGAALDGFEPLLPARRAAWFQTHLKRLRRAAGKVRDLDSILDGLRSGDQGRKRPQRSPDVARVIEIVAKKRAKAGKAFGEAVDRFPGSRTWQARAHKLIAAIDRRDGAPRFDHLGAERLGVIVGRLFTAVADGAANADALHAIRIRAKQARYAIEIFAPTPSPPRQRSLATLEHLQDLAGRCIDQATAAARFARWARRAEARADRKTFSMLAAAAAAAAETARRKAVVWLTPRRVSDFQRDVGRLQRA
jgi:CHAD domain-containing protein